MRIGYGKNKNRCRRYGLRFRFRVQIDVASSAKIVGGRELYQTAVIATDGFACVYLSKRCSHQVECGIDFRVLPERARNHTKGTTVSLESSDTTLPLERADFVKVEEGKGDSRERLGGRPVRQL